MLRGGIRRHGQLAQNPQPQPPKPASFSETGRPRRLSAWPARLPKTPPPMILPCSRRRARLRRRLSCRTARAKASSPSTLIRRIVRNGRPLTVVTVVNDNMPFLFDSVLGEITDTAGEPSFVTHPVIGVRHGKKGVSEILSDGAKDEDVDRLSRHPHPYQCAFGRRGARPEGAARQGADAGARRRRRLEADARPARPGDLGVPLPADPARQGRRRRGDRLPRMAARRQFHLPRHARVPLFRRREERHADPRREPGPRHPRRSRRAGAAPRRGRSHHARDPRLPAWPGSADRDQGERQVDRPPPRLSRLCRHQDLRQERRADRRTPRSSACSPRPPTRVR